MLGRTPLLCTVLFTLFHHNIESFRMNWIIQFDLEKFSNNLVSSISIFKSFGTIWFVPLRSWKVLEQIGPFRFDSEKFLRFLVRFIFEPMPFWNTQGCFLFAPESFGINFFDHLRSWRFWNNWVRFSFDPKDFGLNFLDPLWSWIFWIKRDRFIIVLKSVVISFFDPFRSWWF